MSSECVVVKLTPRLLLYLRNTRFLDDRLRSILAKGKERGKSYTIELSRTVAEEFRDLLTERLAKVGFDREYSLTNEGEVLEELIDRFNV